LELGCDRHELNEVEYEDKNSINGLPPISIEIIIHSKGPNNPPQIKWLPSGFPVYLFNAQNTSTLTLESVYLFNRNVPGEAIFNHCSTTLIDVLISECLVGVYGGGIYNQATLTILDSIIASHPVANSGGVLNRENGNKIIYGSTIRLITAFENGANKSDGEFALLNANIPGNYAESFGDITDSGNIRIRRKRS
jgi:hypothetical protein